MNRPSTPMMNATSRLVILLALLGLWIGTASARPSVIVTVDVESKENLPLPQQMDAVCAGGVRCGLLQIARMLEQRGMSGVFFLNVYEYKAWGEPALRDMAQTLQHRGHDVALHTHPQWAYDPHRVYMYQYSLDEQTRIVADGVRLLQQWTGLPVVAHRAGAYSANADTLTALSRSGITLDASFFPGTPECHLNGLGLPVNVPGSFAGVNEIPVTVYERLERPAGLGRLLPAHRAEGKLDVNSLEDERQAAAALDAVAAADPPFIVLFLHSFSFMNAPQQSGQAPLPNESAMEIFQTLLDGVSAKHLTVVTSREIAMRADLTTLQLGVPKSITLANAPQADIVVRTNRYAIRVLRSQSKGTRLAIAVVAFLLSIGAVVYLLRRRSRVPEAN